MTYMACKLISARLLRIRVFCVSQSDYAFAKRFGAAYLPNFCRFDAEPLVAESFADRSGIICVGRYSPHKRIDKVASFINLQRLKGSLTVVCPSQDVEKYRTHLDAEFLIDLDDAQLRAAYSRARYFISLSDYEGFGLAAIEAVALGCVPILSRNGAYEAFRQQGLRAFSEDDSAAIAQLQEDPNAALKIAQHNHEVMKEYQLSAFKSRLQKHHVL